MTSLLVILVLVLLSVALWQLTKIFDLTQVGKKSEDSLVADDNDNKVNGYLMFAFLGFIYVITIYCFAYYGNLPLMSNAASEHGKEVDQLMWISMILIFIVQTITQALLHYFAFNLTYLNLIKPSFHLTFLTLTHDNLQPYMIHFLVSQ
jgi:cytochrome c oxidase subunit 2